MEIRNIDTGEYWTNVKFGALRKIRKARKRGMDSRAATIAVLGQPTGQVVLDRW